MYIVKTSIDIGFEGLEAVSEMTGILDVLEQVLINSPLLSLTVDTFIGFANPINFLSSNSHFRQ
jgi:hypothetical protein